MNMFDEYKIPKKVILEVSKNDQKILELVKIAKQIVLKEDKILFDELAKH